MKHVKPLAFALTLLLAHQQHGSGVSGSLNRGIYSFEETKEKVVRDNFSNEEVGEEEKVFGGGEKVTGGIEAAVAGRGEKKLIEEGAMESDFGEVNADSKLHLRKRHPGSEVDDFASENTAVIASLSNDVHEIFSTIREISSDDINIDDGPEVLKVAANALSLIKDRLSDPQVISSMPSDFHGLFTSLLHEVSSAEKHVETVEHIVWEHYSVDKRDADTSKAKPWKRILSNEESGLPLKFKSGVSKADYHFRATRRHMSVHQSLGKDSDHQQGYHRARVHREGGGMNRRLNEGNVCVDVDPVENKQAQCIRLAECARNYNLYDLFVFLFGDDIDFDTGSVDSKEKIKVKDESNLIGKLNKIKAFSKMINDKNGELTEAELDKGGTCDKLLQEFHRFDEDLSLKGKWQGGSVTGVCRGWGTNKFMSLESVYFISDTVLNVYDRVENCLEGLVDEFNREQTRFMVPGAPCKSTLKNPDGSDVKFRGVLSVNTVVTDIKRKFECLQWSFFKKINKACPTSGNTLCLNVTTGADVLNGGYVDILVDSGDGYVTVNNNNKRYANGTTVVNNKCFDSILGIQIKGPNDDGWAGSLTLSTNKGQNYSPLTCTDCNGTTSTASIVADKTGDTGNQATTQCLNGNVCNLEHDDLPTVRCNDRACQLFNPVFVAADRLGTFNPSAPFYFDFDIPAVLPSREDRVARNAPFYGTFLIDNAPLNDLTAEKFLIEVFNEYVGCATDLVRQLDGDIFQSSTSNNPYAFDSNPNQFQVPLKINDDATDGHGQINVTVDKLNEIFEYRAVGSSSGLTSDETPQLSPDLKQYLAEVYFFDQRIDDLIKYYKDDCPDGSETSCTLMLIELEGLSALFVENGLDRTSLDTSIALIFGNKTTIGQVCAFARGVEDDMVDGVPGFCCLDAPYETQDWGEKYSCEKYINLEDGSTKVVQKKKTDCKRLGPLTSGFNEAACDVFHGTWCPTPRNCLALRNCIKNAIEEVEGSRDRGAFFEYLDEAPKIKSEDVDDPTECGDLREYFDYERDYPDDDRICNEVLDLQCFTDFSNLDGFATGTAGPGAAGGLAELAVSEKVRLISKDPFDSTAAKAWRSANFALSKALQILVAAAKTTDLVSRVCTTLISAFAGTSAPCTLAAATVEKIITIASTAVEIAISISERIYDEVVGGQNARYAGDRQMSIYENVITNHGNILTTFYATQQLKVMLGEISDGLAEDREEEEGRRMLESCQSVTDTGYIEGCTPVTCEDITRLCDGSFNFPYIAGLKGAGCDDLDSDGDGKKDNCEDRFPPELVVRDAKIFRCNEDDTSQLCYDEKVFTSEKEATNFLEYEFPATDDCQASGKLNVRIEKDASTTCGETVFTLTPEQNISACTDFSPGNPIFDDTFINPLPGTPKQVTISLDEEAPTVTCGFNDPASNTVFDGETSTLYHYMTIADASDLTLKDSNFFFSVTDDCDGEIVDFDDISMVVEFNEVQQNNISSLCTWEVDGSLRAMFSYAPTTCGNVDEDLFCLANPDNVRFYKITVTATDSAGNVGSGSCKVVIVSGCDPDPSNPECIACGDEYCGQDNHYDLGYVANAVAESESLFMVNVPNIANLEGAGCDNIDSDGDDKKDNCEDRFPPELVVRDAKIFRCNEDDTSQLCYDEKVFMNEKEATNFLEYQFPVFDDCQATDNLNVEIEKVIGTTCRDTLFTLTPWQVVDSTCTGFVPDNPIFNDPFVNPLAGTSKNVTVPLDEEAPTITCGFGSDDISINEVVGNTLYHYMKKSDGSGSTLNDAKFFIDVNDNCNDDVNIKMVVESNEVQQNNIAALFVYRMDGSTQPTFLYAPTTCGNVGADLFCRENPYNVRFYNISVSATDSAGNVASDSCKVVIVSGCTPPQDGCFNYDNSMTPVAQNAYYNMDFVDQAVIESQGLFTVASLDFVVTVDN